MAVQRHGVHVGTACRQRRGIADLRRRPADLDHPHRGARRGERLDEAIVERDPRPQPLLAVAVGGAHLASAVAGRGDALLDERVEVTDGVGVLVLPPLLLAPHSSGGQHVHLDVGRAHAEAGESGGEVVEQGRDRLGHHRSLELGVGGVDEVVDSVLVGSGGGSLELDLLEVDDQGVWGAGVDRVQVQPGLAARRVDHGREGAAGDVACDGARESARRAGLEARGVARGERRVGRAGGSREQDDDGEAVVKAHALDSSQALVLRRIMTHSWCGSLIATRVDTISAWGTRLTSHWRLMLVSP